MLDIDEWWSQDRVGWRMLRWGEAGAALDFGTALEFCAIDKIAFAVFILIQSSFILMRCSFIHFDPFNNHFWRPKRVIFGGVIDMVPKNPSRKDKLRIRRKSFCSLQSKGRKKCLFSVFWHSFAPRWCVKGWQKIHFTSNKNWFGLHSLSARTWLWHSCAWGPRWQPWRTDSQLSFLHILLSGLHNDAVSEDETGTLSECHTWPLLHRRCHKWGRRGAEKLGCLDLELQGDS